MDFISIFYCVDLHQFQNGDAAFDGFRFFRGYFCCRFKCDFLTVLSTFASPSQKRCCHWQTALLTMNLPIWVHKKQLNGMVATARLSTNFEYFMRKNLHKLTLLWTEILHFLSPTPDFSRISYSMYPNALWKRRSKSIHDAIGDQSGCVFKIEAHPKIEPKKLKANECAGSGETKQFVCAEWDERKKEKKKTANLNSFENEVNASVKIL